MAAVNESVSTPIQSPQWPFSVKDGLDPAYEESPSTLTEAVALEELQANRHREIGWQSNHLANSWTGGPRHQSED